MNWSPDFGSAAIVRVVLVLEGIFIAMGSTPISQLILKAGGLTDDRGCLIVDKRRVEPRRRFCCR